jgi:hypothetical protein
MGNDKYLTLEELDTKIWSYIIAKASEISKKISQWKIKKNKDISRV